MRYGDLALHNVATVHECEDGVGGARIQRVPDDVWNRLNEGARDRMRRPAGVEVRFAATDPGETVRVTLSAEAEPMRVVPFLGPFQAREPRRVGTEPTTLTVEYPDAVADIDPSVAADLAFSPDVWRLRFAADWSLSRLRVHGVEGPVRPPREHELPDRTLAAYGTSITEGVGASADHLSYVSTAARRLDAGAHNLGTGGSAYCEAAIGEYLAALEWDVAVLGLSVNMLGAGFAVEEFRDRAARLVESVGATGRPVAAVTLFPFAHDLSGQVRYPAATATPDAYREALRAVVADAPGTVHLVEGPSLLDPGGLTTDLTHPGDAGMATMGERLAADLSELL